MTIDELMIELFGRRVDGTWWEGKRRILEKARDEWFEEGRETGLGIRRTDENR